MNRPLLRDRFEIFYNDYCDTLVIIGKDDDSIKLLSMYAIIEKVSTSKEIQAIFNVPRERSVFLKEGSIDLFEKSLKEFYQVLRTINKIYKG